MNNINNIDDINNISTDYAEFIQECFNMKLLNYQKAILNAMEKCNHRGNLVWKSSRDNRKSLYSCYLMKKWLESDEYAESEKE